MSLVIIAHAFDQRDEEAPVYRVLIGNEVHDHIVVTDDDGEPVLDDNDHTILQKQVVDYTDTREILFDATDDKWFVGSGEDRKRRAQRDVMEEQRQIIDDALNERARQAEHIGVMDEAAITTIVPGADS